MVLNNNIDRREQVKDIANKHIRKILKEKNINARLAKYQYGHFNGMEDLYEITNIRKDIPQTKHLFIKNGKKCNI